VLFRSLRATDARQALAPGVRQRRGRSGGLPAMDGRADARPARPPGCGRDDFPGHLHLHRLASECRLLERREVIAKRLANPGLAGAWMAQRSVKTGAALRCFVAASFATALRPTRRPPP